MKIWFKWKSCNFLSEPINNQAMLKFIEVSISYIACLFLFLELIDQITCFSSSYLLDWRSFWNLSGWLKALWNQRVEEMETKESNPWEWREDWKPSWWEPPLQGLTARTSLPTCVCSDSPTEWLSTLQLCRFPSLIKLCLRGIRWWLSTIRWIIDDVGKQNAALMNEFGSTLTWLLSHSKHWLNPLL